MTKPIALPPHIKLVRISKKHRNRRSEYTVIGHTAVKRLMRDFGLSTTTEARGMLQELVNEPATQLDNERATWTCEGIHVDPFAMHDPADMTEVDSQILNLLLHSTEETLRSRFIQSFSKQPKTSVSRGFLEALRQVLQYHPDDLVRQTYLDEIDRIIGESYARHQQTR